MIVLATLLAVAAETGPCRWVEGAFGVLPSSGLPFVAVARSGRKAESAQMVIVERGQRMPELDAAMTTPGFNVDRDRMAGTFELCGRITRNRRVISTVRLRAVRNLSVLRR